MFLDHVAPAPAQQPDHELIPLLHVCGWRPLLQNKPSVPKLQPQGLPEKVQVRALSQRERVVKKATNVIDCKAEDLRERTREDVDIAALVDCGPFLTKTARQCSARKALSRHVCRCLGGEEHVLGTCCGRRRGTGHPCVRRHRNFRRVPLQDLKRALSRPQQTCHQRAQPAQRLDPHAALPLDCVSAQVADPYLQCRFRIAFHAKLWGIERRQRLRALAHDVQRRLVVPHVFAVQMQPVLWQPRNDQPVELKSLLTEQSP